MTASLLAKRCLIAGTLAFASTAMAADGTDQSLTLSFNRTGTDVTSVTVQTAGIDGVTATLTAASPTPFKAEASSAALCPNVNATENPTIVFEFSIAGLPADFSFNQIGFKTHAYNSSAANQRPDDDKNRFYNIDIDANSTPFASKQDQDIAKDNEAGILFWDVTANKALTATNPLTLRLTITKGSDNQGCFFGLEEVTLKTAQEETPLDPTDAKIYKISWQTAGNIFITQTSGRALQALSPSTKNMMFWEFIPTEHENCYYIRNTASGLFIGSCNLEPSSESKIHVGDTPVEYYIGKTTSTDSKNVNCYWMSSTDCTGYNQENGARALNKDGASSSVITWTNGVTKFGSYWTLTECTDDYEPQPFTPSDEIGKPLAAYHIIDAQGRSYSADGNWESVNETEAHRWYFVGTGNADGGYQIVSVKGHNAVNDAAKHTIAAATESDVYQMYQFFNGETALSLGGVDAFRIVPARSDFALKNQIYNMPCGSLGDVFVTKVSIGDDFHYPMATVNNKNLTYPSASKPGNKYVILSKDAALIETGVENPMNVTLNKVPAANVTVTLFIDWDKDGVFEHSQVLTPAKEMTTTISVPEGVEPGISRARLRINDNGMEGPEDDVHGEVLDLRLQIAAPGELTEPTVSVNAKDRGTAAWADGIATAEPKGNALFLYWMDGKRVASTDKSYAVAPASHERHLVAYFSPNTDLSDIEVALTEIDLKSGKIIINGSTLSVCSDYEVKRILVFALNGNLVSSAAATSELTLSLPAGIYIAKAITAGGTITSKIQL